MKILFFIKQMYQASGGAERVLAEVMGGLVEKHDVHLLSFDAPGSVSFYPLDDRITWLKLGSDREGAAAANRLNVLSRMVMLRRAIKALAPDVAIGFMHSAYIPLGLAMLGSKIPIVASEHTVPQHYATRPIEWLLMRLTPKIVDVITVVSSQVKQSFSPSMRQKMVVVPNPVTLSPCPKERAEKRPGDRLIVLSVGRLDKMKDQLTLIRAFALVAEEFDDWDLHIVGEGDWRPQLEREVVRLGLEQRIFLPGRKEDMAEVYGSADIFVLPSYYESFGLVVVEALQFGLPVVGFDNCLGVNNLIVDGENGLLVRGEADRVTSLCHGISSLLSSPDLRNSFGQSRIGDLEDYQLDKVVGCWEELLSRLARARNIKT